jgi:putative CocE/NonD family hydrolase
MLPASDGVKLFTEVFTPLENANGAVVIIRSPYVTRDDRPEIQTGLCAELLRAGYVLVSQHCRGCGKSEGICIPYCNERQDGLALLDWIRKQPFYNKEIYLTGGSYLSSVHLSYLNAAGDDVKGALLEVQDCNRYNILYRNGFFKCGLHGSWAVTMYKRNLPLKKNFTADSFRTFPLSAFSQAVFGEERTFLDEEFSHPDPADPFWETPDGGGDYRKALENLKIPVLFTTGFYDIYTEGVLDMWESLSPESRARCALVVSPYAHAYLGGGTNPIVYKNGDLSVMWPNFKVEWFNAIREKRAPEFVTLGNTTWHAQHEGIWRTAPSLTNGAKEVSFALNDHTLDPKAEPEKEITYTYNPYNPAEFKGGCCNNFDGQQLQSAPDSRYDIISFLTDPLSEDMILQGRGKVTLKVSSDCEDTCFYARLSYVNKDGECYCLRDDIISLASQHPEYIPGTPVEVELNFAPNAVKIAQGERLRLDISSSCWRYFLPHRNKKGNYWEMETAAIARNTIFTGSSKLILLER